MRESAVVLEASFQRLFGSDASCLTFSERLQAQKTAYILQAIGLNIGDYGYRWYKHGPYSQEVQNDLFLITNNLAEIRDKADAIEFTDAGQELINRFKEILNERIHYDVPHWLEAVASLHYLRNYKVSGPTRDKVIDELVKLKAHLNDKEANLKAWNSIEKHITN